MAKKSKENYLNFVPVHASKNEWTVAENGIVTIHMVHNGFYDKIAQKFFHRPRVSHIDLDEQGSFVWQQIDGEKTVGQIANAIKPQTGEKPNQLYARLVQYMQILYNNGFIFYKGKGKMS